MRTACVIACVLAGPSAATERVDRLTAGDRRIGYGLRAYLERNAEPALWAPVRAIVVDHGAIGIVTGLPGTLQAS